MIRSLFASLRLATVATLLVLLVLQVAGAQVMTSSNYQLERDSINVGGGLSSSTNYVQESTAGEVATGPSDSTSFSLRAGYQQLDAVYISMSDPDDVIMDTAIPGVTGGESNGSTTVTITTDSPTGYQLTISAENDPAMQRFDGEPIADYSAGGTPDFTFGINAGEALFGFSPSGVDTADEFLDDGGVCNIPTQETALACWDGLTTVDRIIATTGASNHPTGATTTINFRVGVGSGAAVPAGLYIATTTLTAIPL